MIVNAQQKTRPIYLSFIIPLRDYSLIDTCLDSIERSNSGFDLEIILVCSHYPEVEFSDKNIHILLEKDLNPAMRRNRAATIATGDFLAFIDDDTRLSPQWFDVAIDIMKDQSVAVCGGPDPDPPESIFSQQISQALLETPLSGSGVRCHTRGSTTGPVKNPSDIAMCNMLVRRSIFNLVNGIDEDIGYIGEDTDLVKRILNIEGARAIFHEDMIAYHIKRNFPVLYIKQRFKYRFKNGLLIYRLPEIYAKNPKIWAFLFVGILGLATAFWFPAVFIILAGIYTAMTLWLTRYRIASDIRFVIMPLCFAVHHLTYFSGLIAGLTFGTFISITKKLKGHK